jgi:putative membrane protein insertion efficiency factor
MKYILILVIFVYAPLSLSAQILDNNKLKGDAFVDYLNIYQRYISAIKGSECGMTPSCSNYAIRAFKTYNPIKAFSMTTDRLIRCGHDHNYYNLDINNKQYKAIDDIVDSNNQVDIRYKCFAFADTSHIKNVKFIRYLMNKGFYNQALLKIQELIYDNNLTDNAAKREIYANYIRCLSAMDKLEEAIFEFEVSFPKDMKEDSLILLEIAICHIKLKNYHKSHQMMANAAKNTSDTVFYSRITMLKAKVFTQEYKWQEAKESFMLIPKESIYKQQAEQNIIVLQSSQNIRYKKPLLAGVLGIIPGCGYLYAGHKQTALSALIINAVFGYATYTSVKNKNYGIAALTGTLSLGFYVGNIQGSIKSAKRFNESKKQDLNNRVNVNFNF